MYWNTNLALESLHVSLTESRTRHARAANVVCKVTQIRVDITQQNHLRWADVNKLSIMLQDRQHLHNHFLLMCAEWYPADRQLQHRTEQKTSECAHQPPSLGVGPALTFEVAYSDSNGSQQTWDQYSDKNRGAWWWCWGLRQLWTRKGILERYAPNSLAGFAVKDVPHGCISCPRRHALTFPLSGSLSNTLAKEPNWAAGMTRMKTHCLNGAAFSSDSKTGGMITAACCCVLTEATPTIFTGNNQRLAALKEFELTLLCCAQACRSLLNDALGLLL